MQKRFGNKVAYFRCLLGVLSLVLFMACGSQSAPDCFQSAGDLVREEVSVFDFTAITVFENVSLELQQGPEYKVEVETGEFLRDEISVTVENDRLLLRDSNDCNFFRSYGLTKIYVTAPNIREIRSSTGWTVRSNGTLSFPSLRLVSESFINSESETTDGSFDLDVDMENLSIVVNGITYLKLRGTTDNFNVEIAAGDSRIEAENLISRNVILNHRGSNDLLVDSRESIKGIIRGTGNVISKTRPAEVDVKQLYKGRLLFQD